MITRSALRWTRFAAAALASTALFAACVPGSQRAANRPATAEDLREADRVLVERRGDAIREILAASESDDPFLRANAIEAMQPLPDRVRPLVRLGVDDDVSVVRYAALVTAGRLGLTEMAGVAERKMRDPDPNARAAAIYAAKALGRDVDLSPLAKMLASPDPDLRANAVMLVSWLDEPGSIAMIKEATRAPMRRASAEERAITRVQVAEAVVNLGDEAAIDAVRAAAYSPFDEVRVLAIMTLGRLEDRAMAAALAPMLDEGPIEIRLAAARSLGQMGEPGGLRVARRGAESERPTVRAQAAFALAAIDHPRSAEPLALLLDDPSPQVRLSAAAGVLDRVAR